MALLVACCLFVGGHCSSKAQLCISRSMVPGFLEPWLFSTSALRSSLPNVLASRATTSSWSLKRPHRSRYAASVRPPGSQPTKLRRPEPPKLQKGVGGVAVDLPPVQNLGDDLADAAGGQPLLPRDLVIGPALVEPREDALASRRPAEGGEPFLRRRRRFLFHMSFSVSADGCGVSEKSEHNTNNANPEEKWDSRVAWPFSVVAQSRERLNVGDRPSLPPLARHRPYLFRHSRWRCQVGGPFRNSHPGADAIAKVTPDGPVHLEFRRRAPECELKARWGSFSLSASGKLSHDQEPTRRRCSHHRPGRLRRRARSRAQPPPQRPPPPLR